MYFYITIALPSNNTSGYFAIEIYRAVSDTRRVYYEKQLQDFYKCQIHSKPKSFKKIL